MTPDWTLPRRGYALLLTVAVLCIVAIVMLSQAVTRDLRLLESANSDNVQWTLSQAEVEYLSFESTLDHDLATDRIDPVRIRRKFDIFYSRITTLETGSLYADLRQTPEFTQALTQIRRFLDSHVDVIDRLETTPRPQIVALEAASEQLGPVVRRLANSGLYYFADLSDRRRTSIAVSLQRLALVTTSLIAALALLAYYSHRMGQQTQRGKRALQDAYTRLNTVVNTSLDAVIVSDAQGRILDFNAAAEKIFGYDFADVHGRPLSQIIIPPDLRAAHDAGIARMNQTGETKVIGHGRLTLRAIRANGQEFPLELALESAGQGEDRIVIGFLRDISAQVTAEQDLVEARDRALAGEKAKADFLAVMTHEIRTPLNGVLGNLSLLEDTRLTRQQERYARNMGISARQLMQHVDAVLDIARFESGQIAVAPRPTHLGQMVQDIVDGQSGHAEANGNALQWSWVGPPVTWVMADAARLQQVFLNLIGNAIKFTRDGRVSLEAEQLGQSGGLTEVEFRIIDTGIGIAEADLDRVFEDFQTVDSSFQRQTSGTGLGLGIVRRLVQAMGGTLGVESTLGEGSVFWLRLHFAQTTAPAAQDPRPQRADEALALRVLVVEDNEINRLLIQEMLERLGHHVDIAENGLAGVHAAQAQAYDLILMDISMPVLDGLEASRQIRAGGGASAGRPIVALSANVLPDMRDRIVEAGMTGFLGKPLQQTELRALLSEVSHSAARRDGAAPGPDRTVLDGLRQRYEAETAALMDWLASAPTDHAEIAAQCHKVAGSAAAFDHLALRDALVQVEQAAQNGSPAPELARRIAAARAAWAARAE